MPVVDLLAVQKVKSHASFPADVPTAATPSLATVSMEDSVKTVFRRTTVGAGQPVRQVGGKHKVAFTDVAVSTGTI